MIEKIRAFVEKHWDMVSYLFFGVLTTAVNYLVCLCDEQALRVQEP